MIRSLLTICYSLLFAAASAQTPAISGLVRDTSENKPLFNAVVSIISSQDSTLVTFARTKADGSFNINRVTAGAYTLMVTYPKFADYIETVNIKEGFSIKTGVIAMTPLSELLDEVIITQQKGAIRIKGDTLAYMADSFAVKEGSSVEDLLKRLPGIKVDKSGKITAQGEEVKKVLLDGEEFFSDDPAVVTQNLGADAVTEVQVFDKKSEQAEFTGVDDGKSQKTINLKLKPEKKKGYFGKASLAGGTRGSFDNDAMLNLFKGDRKISAYGIMSNTGRTMLGWQERNQYGEGEEISFNDESGYFESEQNYDDFESESNGLPTAWTGGIHYSDKLNEARDRVNFNYRIFKKNTRGNSEIISQYILPDTQYFNNTSTKSFDTRIMNKLNGSYDWQIDSMSSIKLVISGRTMDGETNSLTRYTSFDEDSALFNTNSRSNNSNSNTKNLNTSLLWRQKFKKKGRTLSLALSHTYDDKDMTGFFQSSTDFYVKESIDRTELIDQKKQNSGTQQDLNTNLTYTEPIGKQLLLSVNTGYHANNNDASVMSLNKDGSSGNYDEIDYDFSNSFKYKYDVVSGGLALKYTKNKINVTIGAAANHATYRQTDLIRDTSSKYDFVNLFPRANLRLKLGPQRGLNIEYRGQTAAPTLQQLQPVRDNTDPLNIQIGNPALRQQFIHNLDLRYNDYKVLNERYIFANLHYNVSQDAISISETVEPGGKRISQAVNVNGNSNARANIYFNRKVSKKKSYYLGGGLDFGYNVSNTLVNLVKNRNDNYSVGLRIGQFSYVQDKYSFDLNEIINYNYTKSSIAPDRKTQYFTGAIEARATIELPGKFSVGSIVSANFREKTDAFDRNRNSIKWDASLSRKFFKGNKGELMLGVNDILNQNIGFIRTATSNFISENTYNTFRRYTMLRFTYRFSKTPGGAK